MRARVRSHRRSLGVFVGLALLLGAAQAGAEPLPSWNDGPAQHDWTVVDRKRDWRVGFPSQTAEVPE